MFGSAVLDTAIGLVFVFFLVALLCSASTEAISNVFQMRGRYLLTGLRAMLDKPEAGATTPLLVTGAGATAAVPAIDASRQGRNTLFAQVTAPPETGIAAAAVNDLAVAASAVHNQSGAALTGTPAAIAGAPEQVVPSTTRTAVEQAGGLTLALFGHPLIHSLQTRRISWPWSQGGGTVRIPQYISSTNFARALVDTLLPDAVPNGASQQTTVMTQLASTITELPEGFPARKSLATLLREADGDLKTFEGFLEKWYDDEMARISGWYKRWSKVVLAFAGLIVAVVVNVDAIGIAHELYIDEPARQVVVAQATSGASCSTITDPKARASCAASALSQAKGALPIGWPPGCTFRAPSNCFLPLGEVSPRSSGVPASDYLLKIMGWLLTAFAVSFGAPFWFDLLGRLGSLRNAGTKPSQA